MHKSNILLKAATGLSLLLLLGSNRVVSAAAPKLAFQKPGAVRLDRASGVAVASDGSVYLGGYTASFGTGAADGDWDVLLSSTTRPGRSFGSGPGEPTR
jgi:hypothetical protein